MSFCYLNNAGMVAFEGAEKKAAEGAGWKVLQATDAANDQATQLTQINALLSQGITILDLHACTADGVVPAIQKANAKGVIVFTPDQPASGGKVAVATTVDNKAAASLACEQMIKIIGTDGKIVQLQGDTGSAAGQDRTDGFATCLKANAPNIKLLNVPTKWDAQAGAAGLKALLNANQDIKAIYMQSDIVFSTAVKQTLLAGGRLHKRGESGHIVLFGVDGGADMIQQIKDGYADFTVSQPLTQYGPIGVQFLQKALDGTLVDVKPGTTSTLPASKGDPIVEIPTGLMVVVPAGVITPDNATDPSWWANQPS